MHVENNFKRHSIISVTHLGKNRVEIYVKENRKYKKKLQHFYTPYRLFFKCVSSTYHLLCLYPMKEYFYNKQKIV